MAKICMLKYGLAYGGISKVTVKLSNELSKRHDVHVINIKGRTDVEGVGFSSSVKVMDINLEDRSLKKSLLTICRRARKYLQKNKFDIVIGMGTITNLVLILSTIGLTVKTIAADHNSIVAGDVIGAFYKFQRYVGTKFSNKSVVLTEETLSDFMKKYKMPRNHFAVIYNWIDDDTVYVNDLSSKRIVTAGRFEVQKGYDFLLPIAKRVLEAHPDWTWHICGDGQKDIKSHLQEFIKQNKLENRLFLEGVVADMSQMYQNSEIYVMTSRYEGLPLVLLEAKQYGLPIVSYNCKTGPSDIVREGINGFLIEQNNEEEMVNKLNLLIENNELRKKFSQAASLDIEKFNKNKILSQWEKLFEELIKV